ncbi:MAG: 5-bromo-4-chloroindolyl phosphate hydrolase [Methyloprofundus sp.]|nr:5-bromo-4-chloroindolyl phosphate hydrolase [Methyloprofundus sp.]
MNNTEPTEQPATYLKKHSEGLLHNTRGLLLYFLPLALIPASILSFIYGDFLRIMTNIGGCMAYLLAAKLLREGIAAEHLYQDKKVTEAPKWPLKTLAASLIGLSTAMIALVGAGHSLIVSLIFGLGAFTGMVLFYGLDPRHEKMVAGTHGYSVEEITATISQAEQKIAGIELANKQIQNRLFNQRITTICLHARDIMKMLEDDPKEIRKARKFLNTYLDGCLKVTQGYADMQTKHQSEQLATRFDKILQTIESVFIEQKQKLLEDDLLDLDVQIEVLSIQLKNEGII